MLEELDQNMIGQRTVVVGAGIIGTTHALWAIARGARVVHLERDLVPHGATVRNFGLVWVSGRASGAELALALRARTLWQGIADDVPGVGFRPNGSLSLLNGEGELLVAERAMARGDAAERGFELLSHDEVVQRNPALRGRFDAGLFCGRDAAVESRVALGALRDWMSATGRYEYVPGRELAHLGDHEVVDHRGEHHRGDQVWICVGATISGFASELFDGEPLRRVQLNMAETEPFTRTLTTSVANGDSFRYYPGFRTDALELLEEQEPLASQYAIQLLCQQRLHGGLTIGDTHEVDEPGAFETRDAPMDLIVSAARDLIGDDVPPIERRWSGVYHQVEPTNDEIYYRRELARGVTALTGAGGRGMTLAPAIAEESFQ
ncbi:MAG TPA: FAD-dependent oxidoreductase [Acidimicrobiales bacterium]|nr:FAD-dependent oxidoreductase [Acidimicrobiales bacterium]